MDIVFFHHYGVYGFSIWRENDSELLSETELLFRTESIYSEYDDARRAAQEKSRQLLAYMDVNGCW